MKRQIEEYKKEYSYLKAVDTSKPIVMSGKISDITADAAIMSIEEEQDYKELLEEYQALKNYIYGISDFKIKELFKLRFTREEPLSLERIAEIVHLDKSTIQRKIEKYLLFH